MLGLKNDYNGVMRGPYLSLGDKGHRTPENGSYEVLIWHCIGT